MKHFFGKSAALLIMKHFFGKRANFWKANLFEAFNPLVRGGGAAAAPVGHRGGGLTPTCATWHYFTSMVRNCIFCHFVPARSAALNLVLRSAGNSPL